MNRSRYAAAAVFAAVAGLTLAAPAYAQDAARPARTVTTVAPQQPATSRDEAARTMPTYEAFGSGDTETTSETMFRLTRDFASTSEIGVRRLGSVPIWPRGDMKFGPFRILPYVREGVEYVSNFYRADRTGDFGSPNGNDAAWTHTNQAGLLADAAFAGGRLRVALSLDAIWDVRYDDGNEDRDFDRTGAPRLISNDPEKADTFEFDGQLGVSYRWPQGVYVRGGVAYERRADPIDVEITKEFQRTNRRTFLTAGMDKDIVFGSRFRFEMGMSTRDTIGREAGLDDLDRTETSYYLKASYPFWKNTTRIFGRARYRQDERESDRINDGYVWGFDAGVEGTIPLTEGEYRGLRGQASVGFDSALYEDETFTTGSTTAIRDENRRNTSLAASVILQYLMSRKSSIDLRYLRTNQFSFHGNYQIVDRTDLTFTHNIGRNLVGRVAGFFEYSDPSGRLRPQEVGAGGDVSGEYPSTTRFGVGAGLRYRINEWMDIDGSYDWERRNNRITGFVNHRATLGVTFYLNGLKARPRMDAGEMAVAAPSSRPVASGASAPRSTTSTPPASSAPAARSTAPAATPPAPAAASSRTGSGVEVRVTGAGTRDGETVTLNDASSRATLTFPDGATVQLEGPAKLVVRSVDSSGYRVQLLSGSISGARVHGTAMEIQTRAGFPSLVLQNASASARADASGTVSFQSMGGEYVKVFKDGSDRTGTDVGRTPWTGK